MDYKLCGLDTVEEVEDTQQKRILGGYIAGDFMYFKGHLEKGYINRYINGSFQHSKVYKPYPYILTHLILQTTL